MGEVRVGEESGRWVIDCGEAGAALRVVVKQSVAAQSALVAESVGHCYTLRPAPAQSNAAGGWRLAAAPAWTPP